MSTNYTVITGFGSQGPSEEELAEQQRIADERMQAEEAARQQQQQEEDEAYSKNFFQQAQDFVAENVLGREVEESRQLRADGIEQQEELQQQINEDDSFGAEAVRAVAGGVAEAGESIAESVDWFGDLARTTFGDLDEEDENNVWSEHYQAADFDIGTAENQTVWGNVARQVVKYAALISSTRAIPGVGQLGMGGGLGARLGGEAARGAIADLIADDGEGNFSNQLEEWSPGLKGTWLTALAHRDHDNIYIRKIKSALEGGVMGIAIDALSEIYTAARAGRAATAAGKSVDEAVDAAIEAPPVRDPNARGRTEENNFNSSTPEKGPGNFEPHERAGYSDSQNINKVIESQAAYEAAGRPSNGAPEPYWDESKLKEALSTNDPSEGVAQIIRQARVEADVEGLTDSLRRAGVQDGEQMGQIIEGYIARGDEALRELVDVDMDGVIAKVPAFQTNSGAQVVRALTWDLGTQIDQLVDSARGVQDIGADAYRQMDMMFDRLQVLNRMDKHHSYTSSTALSSRQRVRMNDAVLSDDAIKRTKSLQEMDNLIGGLRTRLQQGDPDALFESKVLSDALRGAEGDPEKILSTVNLMVKGGADTVSAAMYNQMLSSPRTQVRNAFGSYTNVLLRPMAQAIGFATKGNIGSARVALGAYHGLMGSITEGLEVARKTMKRGTSADDISRIPYSKQVMDTLQKAEDMAQGPIAKGAIRVQKFAAWVYASPWASWSGRAMMGMDDAARTTFARMQLKRDAFEHSFKNGNGVNFDADKYAELVDQKLGLNGKIIDSHLLNESKKITFQQDLTGFAKDFNDITNKYPVAKFFFPFVKTPANLMQATLDYVPGWHRAMGALSPDLPIVGKFADEYRAVMKGTDENAKAIYRGREAIGMTVIGLGLSLGHQGLITGNGPQNPEQRKTWLLNNEPNSIKIGDKWFSYSWIEPLNTILSISADLASAQKYLPNGKFDEYLAQAGYTIAAGITEKSYFQGLIGLTKLLDISGGSSFEYAAVDTLGDLVSVFIPQANLLRGIEKLMIPGKQEFTDNLERELANTIPGYTSLSDAPTRIDVLSGKPIQDANDNGWNFFLPFNIKDADNGVVAEMLAESGITVPLEFSDELKGVKLTPEQKVALQKGMADYGLRDKLEELMKKDWWDKDYQAWKDSGKELSRDDRWYRYLRQEFANARRAAIYQLEATDPAFAAEYSRVKTEQARRRQGEYTNPVQAVIEFGN